MDPQTNRKEQLAELDPMDNQATKAKTLAQKSLPSRIARALSAGKQIVIAISREPSIDQLVAAIGLASLINKQANPSRVASLNKPESKQTLETKPNRQPTRSAIVAFSGPVTPRIGFIKTDEIVSPTIDNYRELVVSIDKNLADKLRYSLDKKVARIHISPFLSNKRGLSVKDLEIGPGAFIIDTLVAIGVNQQEDLDPIIGNHLGILKRDRQLITMAAGQPGPSHIFGPAETTKPNEDKKLRAKTPEPINWCQAEASCLAEMIFELAKELRVELDTDIATILLTGFLSATNRIKLQAAGASQLEIMGRLVKFAGVENKQLVITYLEDKKFPAMPASKTVKKTAKQSTKEQLLTEQEALGQIQGADDELSSSRDLLGLRVATQKGPTKIEESKEDSLTKDLRNVHVTAEGQILAGPAAVKIDSPVIDAAKASPSPALDSGSALNPVTDIDKLGQAKPAPERPIKLTPGASDPASYQPSLIPPDDSAEQTPEAEGPNLAPSPAAS